MTDTRTICELDASGFWTGQALDIGPLDGRPPTWIETAAPVSDAPVPAGQGWAWFGSWALTDLPVPALVPDPVPDAVTNYQARTVLIEAGVFAKADAALRGADQTVAANQIALQAWDYANQFFRNQPIIAAMQAVLGLSDAQVDDLFRAAAKVS
jgi:hypothetical protein